MGNSTSKTSRVPDTSNVPMIPTVPEPAAATTTDRPVRGPPPGLFRSATTGGLSPASRPFSAPFLTRKSPSANPHTRVKSIAAAAGTRPSSLPADYVHIPPPAPLPGDVPAANAEDLLVRLKQRTSDGRPAVRCPVCRPQQRFVARDVDVFKRHCEKSHDDVSRRDPRIVESLRYLYDDRLNCGVSLGRREREWLAGARAVGKQ